MKLSLIFHRARKLYLGYQISARYCTNISTTVPDFLKTNPKAKKPLDLYEEQETNKFLDIFLNETSEDGCEVKMKFPWLQTLADELMETTKISYFQLKYLKQIYDLFDLYDKREKYEENPFLKTVFYDRCFDEDGNPNNATLSPKQFEVIQRIRNQLNAKENFIKNIRKEKRVQLKLKSVEVWGTYPFLSYGHSDIQLLFDFMVFKNGILLPKDLDIVNTYMYHYNIANWANKTTEKQFNELCKWKSRLKFQYKNLFDEFTQEELNSNIFPRDIDVNDMPQFFELELMRKAKLDEAINIIKPKLRNSEGELIEEDEFNDYFKYLCQKENGKILLNNLWENSDDYDIDEYCERLENGYLIFTDRIKEKSGVFGIRLFKDPKFIDGNELLQQMKNDMLRGKLYPEDEIKQNKKAKTL